jgi:L-aspartate oxidase
LVLIGELIVDCAMQRRESRGLHYTLDYPDKNDRVVNSLIRLSSLD